MNPNSVDDVFFREIERPKLLTVSYYVDPREVRIITISLNRFWFFCVAAVTGMAISGFLIACFSEVSGHSKDRKNSPSGATVGELQGPTQGQIGGMNFQSTQIQAAEPLSGRGNQSLSLRLRPPTPVGKALEVTPPAPVETPVAAVEPNLGSGGKELTAAAPSTTEVPIAAEKPIKAAEAVTLEAVEAAPPAPIRDEARPKFGKITFDHRNSFIDGDHMKVSFSVENLTSATISGKVWGVAIFDVGGTDVVVGSSAGVNTADLQNAANSAQGIDFLARKMSPKILKFPIPKDGQLRNVTLAVRNGKSGEVFVASDPF